jgi:hypothetical protein
MRTERNITRQIIDEYLLSQIIKIAFECGESWGVCYSTWFIPSEEEKQQRLLDARKNVKEQLKDKLQISKS